MSRQSTQFADCSTAHLEILRFNEEKDGPTGYEMPYQKRQVYKFFA